MNSRQTVCLRTSPRMKWIIMARLNTVVSWLSVNWGRRTRHIQKWDRKYRDPSLLCVCVVMQVVLAALSKTRGKAPKCPSVTPTLSWRGWSWGWSSWRRYTNLTNDMHQEQQQEHTVYITHLSPRDLSPRAAFSHTFPLTGTHPMSMACFPKASSYIFGYSPIFPPPPATALIYCSDRKSSGERNESHRSFFTHSSLPATFFIFDPKLMHVIHPLT